jgi:3D (Asp-Asp-Asp) domain-containing protein
MPPVAVVVALTTLLHASTFALTSPELSLSWPDAPISVAAKPHARTTPSPVTSRHWVAAHAETPLWSAPAPESDAVGVAHQWAPFEVVGEAEAYRLPILDPSSGQPAWVDADAVGPVDPALVGTEYLPPAGVPITWGGSARITRYTCVELGGCAPTASGLWPEPGMVAVDPRVIPLGSMVWIQGLGTFVATDTGSLVRGAHLDVFTLSYPEALEWGVQYRAILVFAPNASPSQE